MYSLTKATEIFTKHYQIWNENISYEVLRYNTHKLRHSIGVLETGRNLLIKMKENMTLSAETINRAEMVLFLHDLGRFYQNNKQRILTNSECEHGDLWAKIAREEGYDDKIYLAIKHHNKYSLVDFYEEKLYLEMNQEEKTEAEFLAKFIRDADKLQNMIYEVFNIEWLTTLNPSLKHGDISDEIVKDVEKWIPVERKNIKTFADEIIWVLCRVYDINFQESFDMLRYYWYFEKIIQETAKLQGVNSEKMEKIKQKILNSVK